MNKSNNVKCSAIFLPHFCAEFLLRNPAFLLVVASGV